MGLNQFSGLLIANIFATSTATNAMKDTSAALHTVSANTSTSLVTLVAGSGVTAPTFGDFVIDTAISGSSGSISATVNNTITNNVTNGTFTITGTFTNILGVNTTYGNIGIYVTAGGNIYMLAHDQTNGGTGYVVSPAGTVAVTYTVTVS